MDIAGVVNIILPIIFCLVGVALIVFVVELIKLLKSVRGTVDGLGPTLENVENITTNIQPTLAKVDPLMDRVQLTVDSVNLEMMRVDQILENVADITETASSATQAVDNITAAPLKAVNSVADRVRNVLGPRNASDESEQLGSQRDAIEKTLADYKAAEKADAQASAPAEEKPQPEHAAEAPKSYVKDSADGEEPVIDPKVIAESSFFDEGPDAR
ncbi:MAG: DUF948 domain-containing protein [Eggerthellaceae bacterium]|nr:DUF948 domain-containing protein [Eggerthellaceae bacterium]